MKLFQTIAVLAVVAMAAKTDQDLKKKLKDKKSRSIRKLRKEAPVRLSSDGGIEFDTDSAAIHCLTSSTDDYQNAGTIDFNLAQIVVCQKWIVSMTRADQYLQDAFGVELLTDDEIDYDNMPDVQSDQWGVDEGPNAKNTVIALLQICKDLIPEDYPIEISGKRCHGGVKKRKQTDNDTQRMPSTLQSSRHQVFQKTMQKRNQKQN